MFEIFFGWRKASKCKKLIKQVQCQFKVLKKRRHAIVKQSREVLGQLGKENMTFNRVEHFIKDERIEEAYELLDHFCEFILVQFSHIREFKDCPDDINEAVSSLIYASARCGDLPQLMVIRNLFKERYGEEFVKAAVELLPGNLVNQQVKEKLSMRVSDAMKHIMVNKIVEDYNSDGKKKLEERKEHQVQSDSSKDLDIITSTTSDVSSVIQLHFPVVSECLKSDKEEKVENSTGEDSQITQAICLETKEEKIIRASSSEILPILDEESVVYLDDVEEFQSSNTNVEDSQDLTLSKFRSSIQFKNDSFENSCDQIYSKGYESRIKEKLASKKSQRSCSLSCKKRSRRRFVFQDIESIRYYGQQPHKKKINGQGRKPQKKTPVEESEMRPHEFHSSEMAITCFSSKSMGYPKHVHPKLPDYDDIKARFMALKIKENQN